MQEKNTERKPISFRMNPDLFEVMERTRRKLFLQRTNFLETAILEKCRKELGDEHTDLFQTMLGIAPQEDV